MAIFDREDLIETLTELQGVAVHVLSSTTAERIVNSFRYYWGLQDEFEMVFDQLHGQQLKDIYVGGEIPLVASAYWELIALEESTIVLTVALHIDKPRVFFQMANSRPLFIDPDFH